MLQEVQVHERILADNPLADESCAFLAAWHLDRRSFRAARQYYGHLSTLRRSDPSVWFSLAMCCCFGGDLEESTVALKEMIRLTEKPGGDIRASLLKGLIAEKHGDLKEALTIFEATLVSCSTLSTAEEGIDAAAGFYQGMDAIRSFRAHIRFLKEVKGEATLHMAIVKKDMGDVQGAKADCARALADLARESEPSVQQQANLLVLDGILHEMTEEHSVAELQYRKCCQIDPTHALGYERLGRLYLTFRETTALAAESFSRAIELVPTNGELWYLLGRCYMTVAQYEDAHKAYERAINLEPNEPHIWVSLGILFHAFSKYKEAQGMFVRALRLKPDCAEAWYNLGVEYEMDNNPEEAERNYSKAREYGLAHRMEIAGLTLVEPKAEPQTG